MKKISNFFAFILICFGATLLSGCGPIQKEDIEGSIDEIIDGNTIVLSTGTTIHLCGIDPNNARAKQYMETHYIGEDVYLVIESNDEPTIDDYDEEFYAYVHVAESDECINRTLLTVYHDAFSSTNCTDRLKEFAHIVNPSNPREELTAEMLSAKMKAATLQLHAGNESKTWLGTAFIISKNGLAITNCHCLENAEQAIVLLSDSEGNLSTNKVFGIKPGVYKNSEYDYAVFYVDFDEDTRSSLSPLPLTRRQYSAGTEAHSVGNPAPSDGFSQRILPMRFNSGHISSYNEEDKKRGRIAIDVPITHGFSGGPLCNKYGEVIGINVSGFENSDANLNFAVDIKKVREYLDNEGMLYEGK